ncbi:hypothetical protein BOW53_03660 [Solemya pervernicosa gill symbiont]|uniref:diguanylate cyclase n=1 Tax=Solemya pervernicosa gill symbiont TaxID=642797 RepID=A0A1T2L8S0_9GAMM|nr:diguanylate cyclase [Solemya pervernicosa gill symbiont]OOZ41481.1 hypothetical protein BOW53_03660 [Solemya pervernicosa gill symbiont]
MIISLLISIIPAGMIGIIGYSEAKGALERSTLAGLNAVSEFREGELFLFLNSFKIVTRNYASDGYIRDQLLMTADARTRISSLTRLNKHLIYNKVPLDNSILYIDVLSHEGIVIASSDESKIGVSKKEKRYYTQGLQRTFISDIHAHKNGPPELEVASPIYPNGMNENPIGVLVVHFSAEAFNNLLRGQLIVDLGAKSQIRGIGKTGETYLVDRNSRMITDSLFLDNSDHELQVNTYPVEIGISEQQEVTGLWDDYRGVPVAGSSMVITMDDFFCILISEQDQDEAFQPITQLRDRAITLSVAMFLCVIVIALATARTIFTPLNKLMRGIETIGEGDLSSQVTGVNGNHEIGTLAQAFNRMCQSLGRTQASLEEKNRKLEELSTRDGLTGLYNHRYLKEKLEYEFNRAQRYKTPLCVMMLDLDHFKRVNDTYGHLFGDYVLKESAKLLTQGLRKTDIIGRYGGEEFMVISPNTPLDNAEFLAHKLRKLFDNHTFTNDEISSNVTISIGAAKYYESIEDYNGLINVTDRALYSAKQAGRNRVCLDGMPCETGS